jgi:hypothetical protein
MPDFDALLAIRAPRHEMRAAALEAMEDMDEDEWPTLNATTRARLVNLFSTGWKSKESEYAETCNGVVDMLLDSDPQIAAGIGARVRSRTRARVPRVGSI